MKLTLNPIWKWIAKEKSDHVYAYQSKPEIGSARWEAEQYISLSPEVFDIPDLGEWKDSLHEILPDGTLRKYVPLPELPVDTKVLVRDTDECPWKRRHFAEFGEDGRIRCWGDGATSFSSESVTNWEQWKLYEEELEK